MELKRSFFEFDLRDRITHIEETNLSDHTPVRKDPYFFARNIDPEEIEPAYRTYTISFPQHVFYTNLKANT
jgi:hypothetical protein